MGCALKEISVKNNARRLKSKNSGVHTKLKPVLNDENTEKGKVKHQIEEFHHDDLSLKLMKKRKIRAPVCSWDHTS